MGNYMDDAFVVVNNTIISYCGEHPVLKLPSRFADIEILRIGNGSFMESSKLQCAILPPTVQTIGASAFFKCPSFTSVFVPGSLSKVESRAFSNCEKLRDITIYGLELTANEYFAMKNAGIKNSEGIYILRKMPEHPLVEKLVAAVEQARPACQIPDGITALFQLTELDEEKGAVSLNRNLPVIGFVMPSKAISEHDAFYQHVMTSDCEVYDSVAEQKNDWYVRLGKRLLKGKTVVFTFDDSETQVEDGKFRIKAVLQIGYFFWQSAQPVSYDKKKYYVYRRYYLSADPEIRYVRRDIAVYNQKGPVKNREEAQDVYAKYKLLSIL